jgi:hypothetical protein
MFDCCFVTVQTVFVMSLRAHFAKQSPVFRKIGSGKNPSDVIDLAA